MKYEFIGWERDEKENVDKVWGMIRLDDGSNVPYSEHKYVSFWGRRGKKLQTKFYECHQYEMVRMCDKKEKTYTEIKESKLHTVYPEFQDDLEKTAVWALLSN
jgi:hypothetical protein